MWLFLFLFVFLTRYLIEYEEDTITKPAVSFDRLGTVVFRVRLILPVVMLVTVET